MLVRALMCMSVGISVCKRSHVSVGVRVSMYLCGWVRMLINPQEANFITLLFVDNMRSGKCPGSEVFIYWNIEVLMNSLICMPTAMFVHSQGRQFYWHDILSGRHALAQYQLV